MVDFPSMIDLNDDLDLPIADRVKKIVEQAQQEAEKKRGSVEPKQNLDRAQELIEELGGNVSAPPQRALRAPPARPKAAPDPRPPLPPVAPTRALPARDASRDETIIVPMDDILVDEKWNVRGTIDPTSPENQLLAAAIAEQGLLSALTVWVNPKFPDKLCLVAGFRRYAALKINKAKHARVTVMVGATELDADFANVAENVARQSLPPWQVAVRCARYRQEHGLTDAQIARRIGLSPSRTAMLIRLETKLHPKLLRVFHGEQAAEGSATKGELERLVKFPPQEQIRRWEQARTDRRFHALGENCGIERPGRKSHTIGLVKILSVRKLERALVEMPAVVKIRGIKRKITETERLAATQVLRWVMGLSTCPFATKATRDEDDPYGLNEES